MTKTFFTIDTEYEFGFTAKRGADSRRANFDRSIRCATPDGEVGVFYQADFMRAHGLKAVFFVDPLPGLLWGTEAISDIVGPILERGHDVQLHLHTEWLELAGEKSPVGGRTGRNIKDFAFEDQCALLDAGRAILMAAGAPRPAAFRAGNYGADDRTLRALAETGFRFDSSHTPGISDSECAISLGPDDRRPCALHAVTEVPIGCVGDTIQGLRHAQLSALSLRELLSALRHARAEAINDFTIVSHSFELLSRDRKRINKLLKRRFERFCESLAAMEGVTTATYQTPPQASEKEEPRPILPGSIVRTGMRVIEQATINTLYGNS